MQKLIKLVKVNNVQYNANRDPEFYRRSIDKEFRVQALMSGTGTARGRFEVEGKTVCEKSVALPGTFECKVAFPTAGVRLGTLVIEGNGETFTQDIRLDVMEHDWIG